jgi:hypothetical protein
LDAWGKQGGHFERRKASKRQGAGGREREKGEERRETGESIKQKEGVGNRNRVKS